MDRRLFNAINVFLCHLTLDLKTWCIIVEEETGGIAITNLSAIRFELYWRREIIGSILKKLHGILQTMM